MAPTEFLNDELDLLLNRLVEVDTSKWQALQALGLPPMPSAGARKGR